MSLADEKRLFKPYFKNTDPAKEQIESHGLGLSLSQQIAKSMGGQIKYRRIDDGC
jgi:signal transduction histidine kinase